MVRSDAIRRRCRAGRRPTGTITFTALQRRDVHPGRLVGTVTKAVTGNGAYTSPSFMPTAAGTYHWIANYGGDANNSATRMVVTARTRTSSCQPRSPTVTTQARPWSRRRRIRSDRYGDAGGRRRRRRGRSRSPLRPDDATCTTARPVVTATKAVTGNGVVRVARRSCQRRRARTAGSRTTAATRTTTRSRTACNGANENVVVDAVRRRVTTQASADVALGAGGNDLTDTATLSGATTPTGTITFTLYGNDATCTPAGLVSTVTKTVAGNGGYVSPSFTSTRRGRIAGSRTTVATRTTTRPRTAATKRTRTSASASPASRS